MFPVQDVVVLSAVAGVLAAALLWAVWRWSRLKRRFLIAGVTTLVGFMAWNFTLNATQAVPNFDVDAPIIRLSWADVGSCMFACLVTALVLGLITDRHEPAYRVMGAAGIAGLAAVALDLFVL